MATLGVTAFAAPARADVWDCMALCAMQEAYCDASGGTLVGACYYDWGTDVCHLNGCDLPQVEG